jgi:hypothetical protein
MHAHKKFNMYAEKYSWTVWIFVLLIMVGAFFFYYFVVEYIRAPFDLDEGSELVEGIAAFITVIGIVFALIMTFTYQQAINRHLLIRKSIFREVNSLHNIVLLSKTMEGPKGAQKKIVSIVQEYLDYMITGGFDEKEGLCEDAYQNLFDIITELRKVASDGIKDRVDRISLDAIHEELRVVSSARSGRLTACKSGLPKINALIVEFLGLVLIIGFLFLDMGLLILESTLFALVLGAILLLFVILRDMDDPFYGVWKMKTTVLKDLRRELKRLG